MKYRNCGNGNIGFVLVNQCKLVCARRSLSMASFPHGKEVELKYVCVRTVIYSGEIGVSVHHGCCGRLILEQRPACINLDCTYNRTADSKVRARMTAIKTLIRH